MRAKVLILVGMALLPVSTAFAQERRSIAFRPTLGSAERFTVVHQIRYRRGDGLVDGPGVSYRLSVTVLTAVRVGYVARVTIGAVARTPATVPGIDLDTALVQGVSGLTFDLVLDRRGRPIAIEEWGELRLELAARAVQALAGDPAGALVAGTTLRLIRTLDARQAAQLLARPLAVMAEVRGLAYEASGYRVDLRLPERVGATLLPGPFDWDVSIEPLAVGGQISARWQARPTAAGREHREDGAGVYGEDGWPTRLTLTATTLDQGDLVEQSLAITMVPGR